MLWQERGECIFIPLKIAMRKRCKNADEGVVLVAIQIAVDSDLSTERTVPPRSTHVQPGDVSHALIQQGERERLGRLHPAATRRHGGGG